MYGIFIIGYSYVIKKFDTHTYVDTYISRNIHRTSSIVRIFLGFLPRLSSFIFPLCSGFFAVAAAWSPRIICRLHFSPNQAASQSASQLASQPTSHSGTYVSTDHIFTGLRSMLDRKKIHSRVFSLDVIGYNETVYLQNLIPQRAVETTV